MIWGCWCGKFVALSTSTSCQTSALQSLPFLLLRTNFAANSLPVAFSVHLLTTAYCPLKVNFVKINPKKRTDLYYLQRLEWWSAYLPISSKMSKKFSIASVRGVRAISQISSRSRALHLSQTGKWASTSLLKVSLFLGEPARTEIFGPIDLSHSICLWEYSRSFRTFA